MAGTLNRHQQKSRPKHPTSLENSTLDFEHVPDVFDTWKLTVEHKVHMLSTAGQQKLLKNAQNCIKMGHSSLTENPLTSYIQCMHLLEMTALHNKFHLF